jgi:hypothetical protein
MKHSTAIAQLRHLYQQMMGGHVSDTIGAAEGLLGPAIEALEESQRRLASDMVFIDERLDCGDNSCQFAAKRGGMRTNAGCRCIGERAGYGSRSALAVLVGRVREMLKA